MGNITVWLAKQHVEYPDNCKLLPLNKFCNSMSTGLISTTYYMQYPHAVPFLRNKMPYSLLKSPKTHV